MITFGTGAQNLTIDLGADDDAADTLTFQGSVSNAMIRNWELGRDVVDVVDAGAWSVSDDGTDTTLSDGVSTITFLDVTGLTGVDDFLL